MSLVELQPCRESQVEVAKLSVVYQKGFTHRGSIFFPFTSKSFGMYVCVCVSVKYHLIFGYLKYAACNLSYNNENI